jgi:hypothetical protein
LSRAELESCFAIIGDGGAVNVNTMRRDLPNFSVLAIACAGGRIVGVGAIKPGRKSYAAKVAKRIALVLVSSLADRLFATRSG